MSKKSGKLRPLPAKSRLFKLGWSVYAPTPRSAPKPSGEEREPEPKTEPSEGGDDD